MWSGAVSKLTSRSARGADGFDAHDLQRMSESWHALFANFLTRIEHGMADSTVDWSGTWTSGLKHHLHQIFAP